MSSRSIVDFNSVVALFCKLIGSAAPAVTKELLYTGKVITVAQTEDYGVLDQCVNVVELDGAVLWKSERLFYMAATLVATTLVATTINSQNIKYLQHCVVTTGSWQIMSDHPFDNFLKCSRQEGFSSLIGPFRYNPEKPQQCVFPVVTKHCNPEGYMHGGMLMSFADFLMYHAIGLEFGHDAKTPSIHIETSFKKGVKEGDLVVGEAVVTYQIRQLIHMHCDVWVISSSGKKRVGTASGIYKVLS